MAAEAHRQRAVRQLSGKVPLQRRDGEALKAACRFAATENGVTRFRGVIDEWGAVCGAEGTVLTVEGAAWPRCCSTTRLRR